MIMQLTPEQLAKWVIDGWELEDVISFAVEHLTLYYTAYPIEFQKSLAYETEDLTPDQIASIMSFIDKVS
jgi:hypothetical protein